MLARTIAGVLLLLLITTGCAKPIIVNAFDGPDRPDTEVATMELDFRARLVHLDGRPVAGIPSGLREGDAHNPRSIRLLPGEHEVLVGMRPYVETHSTPVHGYVPGGDCGSAGGTWTLTHYYATTSVRQGLRDNDHLRFTVAPGRHYRMRIREPFNWFSRGERWNASVVEKTDEHTKPIVSTSLGRERHVEPWRSSDGIDELVGAAALKTMLGPLESPR